MDFGEIKRNLDEKPDFLFSTQLALKFAQAASHPSTCQQMPALLACENQRLSVVLILALSGTVEGGELSGSQATENLDNLTLVKSGATQLPLQQFGKYVFICTNYTVKWSRFTTIMALSNMALRLQSPRRYNMTHMYMVHTTF